MALFLFSVFSGSGFGSFLGGRIISSGSGSFVDPGSAKQNYKSSDIKQNN